MITIYNKIEKSMDNTSGFQVISNVEMLERPFLLCISARNNVSKSIYGMIREGAQAARVQTTKGAAAGFILNSFPIDFLGFRFQQDEEYHQAYVELANELLYPYLIKNGKSFEQLRTQARKMNFITYCDGAYTFKGAEERLEVLLQRDGLNDEDIHDILSQMSVVIMGSMIEAGDLHATSVTFIDVNDKKLECEKTVSYRELLESNDQEAIYSPLGSTNGILYIYNGNGIHSVKSFFKDDENVAKPSLCAVVSMFLESSLKNSFEPIDVTKVMNRLDEFTDESVRPTQLLEELDSILSYNGAPKYTPECIPLKMELDSVYKLLRKTNELFINSLEEKNGQERRLNSVIRGLYEFSSDITFEQVLTYARMWYVREGDEILSIPSDKQVRATVINDEAKK